MKKLLLTISFIGLISSSCKKDYCWVCTNSNGGDENICGMTKKDAERKESSGYSCVRK
jgi:hypothetical protein